jgi:hypothetical protein
VIHPIELGTGLKLFPHGVPRTPPTLAGSAKPTKGVVAQHRPVPG